MGFSTGGIRPPRSALTAIQAAEDVFAQLGVGRLATITGRYWAMDRDQRWDRLEKSYRLLCSGDRRTHSSFCYRRPASRL